MTTNRKYVVAVALLAVLAVVFGIIGTVAPPLAEEATPQQTLGPSSDSVGHFQNPPTYDSGWVDIRDKCGQYFSLKHNLNTTDMIVDITGKQSLDPMGGAPAWSKTYGGTSIDYGQSVIQTGEGGYALAGYTDSFGAGVYDCWLVKTDSSGIMQWNKTYGGTGNDRANSLVQTVDGGYTLAGYTTSFGAGYSDFWLVKTDAAGNMQWNESYGGAVYDIAYSVVQTSDGGYTIAGFTTSFGAGSYDAWLVKTDSSGAMQWSKTYGGTGEDRAYSVVQTVDGGYALAGDTWSYGAGVYDCWLVKTDSSGAMQWNKTYGGGGGDRAYSVVQTVDGGYALAGDTTSFGAGSYDAWVVKTDSSGAMQWNKTYGGTNADYGQSVIQTGDSGYALASYTDSFGAGSYDAWVVKTDSSGAMQWSKTYGGTNADYAYSVVQAGDSGYALAGGTKSFGAGSTDCWLVRVKPEMNLEHQRYLGGTNLVYGWSRTYGVIGTGDEGPGYDEILNSMIQTIDGGYALAGVTNRFVVSTAFWLVKTDSAGTMQWNRTFGGTYGGAAYSVIQTIDGGYALVGSYDAGMGDTLLIKTGASGFSQWSETYGGTNTDIAYSVIQTIDGGYALAGYTNSYGAGNADFWLVKTDSAGTALWNKTYGGAGGDIAYSVIQTIDGGYALAGTTNSYGAGANDFWLVRTDSTGAMLWNKTYGGAKADLLHSMIQTVDEGYAMAGVTYSFGAGIEDFWLVKTDSAGTMQWNKTYGGTIEDEAYSLVRTLDGGYALAGDTVSFGTVGVESIISRDFWLVKTDSTGTMQWSKTYGGEGQDSAISLVQTFDGGLALAGTTDSFGPWEYDTDWDFYLVKTDVEMGLTMTALTNGGINLYRGKTDSYWNYVCVRIWVIKEPTWIYGDINMDGIVDAKDLYIVGRNYGKTFSLLSLTGIMAVAGVHTVRTRKRNRQQGCGRERI